MLFPLLVKSILKCQEIGVRCQVSGVRLKDFYAFYDFYGFYDLPLTADYWLLTTCISSQKFLYSLPLWVNSNV